MMFGLSIDYVTESFRRSQHEFAQIICDKTGALLDAPAKNALSQFHLHAVEYNLGWWDVDALIMTFIVGRDKRMVVYLSVWEIERLVPYITIHSPSRTLPFPLWPDNWRNDYFWTVEATLSWCFHAETQNKYGSSTLNETMEKNATILEKMDVKELDDVIAFVMRCSYHREHKSFTKARIIKNLLNGCCDIEILLAAMHFRIAPAVAAHNHL